MSTNQTDLEAEAANEVARLDEALTHPDPDPATLPAIPPGWHPASEQQARHLCRAILRRGVQVEALRKQAREDAVAWADKIRAAEARVEQQEASVLAFLVKYGAGLETPWFTAYVQRHADKIIIYDPEAALAVCKAKGWTEAVRIKEEIVKKEFDALYNADPDAFTPGVEGDTPIAESVPREPSLVIRPTAAGQKALQESKA